MLAALALLLAIASTADTARTIVCGFDVSGSMEDLWRDARAACEAELTTARPGDVVIIRTIGAQAYTPRAEIVRVRLPADSAVICRNPFDTRCRATRQRSASVLQERRRQACQLVTTYTRSDSGRTDLLGFLQAASDEFAAHAGQSRRLVIATDGDPSVRQSIRADLAGTHVHLVMLRTDNSASAATAVRARWHKRLQQLGADSVTIHTRAEGPRCSSSR